MSEDATRDEEERPAKRFKHLSYKQSLKDVRLPSALEQARFDDDIADNDSHFHQTIDHWRQLNLAPSFIQFANKADGLSASMPLLLHHHSQIVELWITALDVGENEALKAFLDLLQKLAYDLRTTLAPCFENLISRLAPLLRRAIPSDAFTTLLATFSALFKYIMIPSDDFEVIQRVWASFKEALLKCSPEVRQATAEVWGVLVRKLKLPARVKLVALLVSDLNGVEDFIPWVIVDACKSVAQSIHTAAPSIISQLLRCYVDTQAAAGEFYHVIRRILTALIHNVNTPEQFSPITTVVLDTFKSVVASSVEKTTKFLPVVVTICSVRRGSRLTASQLKEIAGNLNGITPSEGNRVSLLQLSTSVLVAGDSSLWVTVGKEIIVRSWETDVSFAIELSGSLCELGWGGWKSFGLSPVLKHTHRALETAPTKTLRLLAWLVEEHKLTTVDAVWKQRTEGWIENRLLAANWQGSEEDIGQLCDILTLSPLLANVNRMLDKIVQQVLTTDKPLEDFQRTPYNASSVLGMCLKSFSGQAKSSKSGISSFDIAEICQRWGWSESVTGGLASLATSSSGCLSRAPLEKTYTSLKEPLLSHSQSLRLNVLRVLSSSLVVKSPEEREVIKRCLQCENISIDVQGSRERALWIGRLPQIVPDGQCVASDIAISWLVSQLKVNLRPLWAPTMKALSELSTRCDPVLWSAVFEDLRRLSEGLALELSPEWVKESFSDDGDDIQEVERTWQDPSAHKMRVAISTWTSDRVSRRRIVKMQVSSDRFDPMSYHAQLLGTLGECSSLAEKHNRDLIPLFLSTIPDHGSPAKHDRRKLSLWLTLFSKFSNPNALYATADLRSLYTTLFSHPDRSLQRLALKCMLTYRSPHLTRHQDTFTALLDDTRWRDELTKLNLDEIDDRDRPEFVETFIRLLYGLMLERRGNSKTGERRGAVVSAFAGCRDEELGLFVELMLGPLRREDLLDVEGRFVNWPVPEPFSEPQQVGYLNLLEGVLRHLGSRLLSFWPVLLGGTLDILAHAQKRIDAEKTEAEAPEPEEEPGEEDTKVPANTTRTLKTIRQLSLKRFTQFCESPVQFDFSPFIRVMFRTAISPRLPVLGQENSQAPSALLELFYVWATKPEQAIFLTTIDHRTLPNIYDCMVSPNVKPTVISRVLDIIEALLSISSSDEEVSRLVLKPYIPELLESLATAVERSKDVAVASNVLGHRQISILSELAPHLSDAKQASILLTLFSPLLKKLPKVVPETVKANMINIISNLFPLIPDLQDPASSSFHKTFMLLSQLMQSLRTRPARSSLISAYQKLVEVDSSLSPITSLIDDLNAYSTRRVDEPDFDRRISAFTRLDGDLSRTFSLTQWIPILYNMLHFIQDAEELALRTNSATVLRIFIDIVSRTPDGEWEGLLVKNVYPGLKNGLRSKHELVRAEILAVIAHAVTVCQNIPGFQEMRILLADGDEEVNFFNNIHHVQVHRRIRALRRFGEWCGEGQLRSSTLADVFLPLIGNYIGATDSIDHHLVTEAINTTGSIARYLAWGAYNKLIHQYLRLVKQKDASERLYVRTIVAILDNFHFNMDESVVVEGDADENAEAEEPDTKRAQEMTRIADSVHSRLLPALLNHLERRDENEDTTRIPIAVGIINVAKHLPDPARTTQITRLLTVLSQAFRSRSQETRDLTRGTLCRIAVTLGPEFLPDIVRELRSALLRGPHLHVLAVVTHSLLVHLTSPENSGRFTNFDSCVEDIAYVSAEVIFGESGKDARSEGFKTKLREARSSSSKGLDSFFILAKHITSGKISALLHPVRAVMQETETLKVLQLVDDVLKKIAGGINSNERISPSDLLSLCQTLITQNAKFLQAVPAVKKNRSKKGENSSIVQLKRTSHIDSNHYANNSFRFIVFGLDLFHTAHKRNRFDFQDPDIIRRLEPMVPVVGNTLYSQSVPVLILGMKSATAILQCPLRSGEKASPVVANQIIEVIRATGSTESGVVQTGLRSLSVILRHHDNVQVKEKDLLFLLEFIAPDLEEPNRQGTVFTVLRAIIARRFVVPEMYDLMDNVSEVMVTSQSPQVQEHCRGVLLQFLLEYPQGRNRLKNQMTSLAKNLSYVYESGRASVLELLNALVNKFEVGLVYEYSDLLFVALVMVIANDGSTKCREMAAELIKSLYLRLDESRRKKLLSHLHTWISQATQQPLIRVSCQVYGFILTIEAGALFSDALLEDVNSVLERSSDGFEEIEEEDGEGETSGTDTWQVPYQALVVLAKLLAKNPELAKDHSRISWSHVVPLLLYPHAWVRTASCRLLGTMLATVPPGVPRENVPSPSSKSLGLFTREWMEIVTQKLCLQLKSEHLGEDLSLHIVKNLFYFGRCFSEIPFPTAEDGDGSDDGRDEPQQDSTEKEGRHPLRWLFSRLSFQARSAYIARRNKAFVSHDWSRQPSAILKWFAAMAAHLSAEVVEAFLVHILTPVYRIAEDDSIRDSRMDELKLTAIELQDVVRSKVGGSKFAEVYSNIRQGVLGVQRERKITRTLQHTTNPEVAAKRKIQRNVSKKESRKRKDAVFLERKGRIKRMREV